MVRVSSWGRLFSAEHQVFLFTHRNDIKKILQNSSPGITYGMGRSYGDVCLNPSGTLWNTSGLDRYIEFNAETGRLRCEAGVLLRDIQHLMIPRGWTLAVTPGTQIVTVGGAIANDVHGKNHHIYGTFGDQIKWLKLVRTTGEIIECSPDFNAEWLKATVGGVGLTGIIIEAEIQLRPIAGPWLDAETVPYQNLDEFFMLSDESENGWEHTVSWIDCISGGGGRGLFMRANPIVASKKSPKTRHLKMPFTPPISLVNKLSLKPFNLMYYHLKKWQAKRSVVHYEPFFYPLDNLLEWNRMYGPKGFFQYQSVVPRENGKEVTQEMLKAVSQSGDGSFLAVIKTFGNRQSSGFLSFPQPGVTLAMDIPNHGEKTARLFDRLDRIVMEANGRLYLAKDARMSRNMFEKGYPLLTEFLKYRDPGISSSMSRRLMGS